MLYEQYVHLRHHVHRLEQVFRIVSVLAIERIEPVVNVILEILQRRNVWQDFPDKLLVGFHYVVKCERFEVVSRLQVDKLPEREPSQVVALHDAAELVVLILEPHHAATGKDDVKVWIEIVAFAQFACPVRLFEHLVDKQHSSSVSVELPSEVCYSPALEIKVVHIYIQTLFVSEFKVFFCILQEESGFSHSSRPLDSDHAVVPVYLVHQ